jgi:hypothetical protein
MGSHGPRDNQCDWEWLSTKEQGKTHQRENFSLGTLGGDKSITKQKTKEIENFRNKEVLEVKNLEIKDSYTQSRC